MKQLKCDICLKTFEVDAMHQDEGGDYCIPCIEQYHREGALAAGIPLSVIEGRTKLSDHFSEAYIDMQCGREPKGDV